MPTTAPAVTSTPSTAGGAPQAAARFTAEEAVAMVLTGLRQRAEQHLSAPVQQAVLATPTHFDFYQRQALIDAAGIAGLNVLRLISEPAAAALAYVAHLAARPAQPKGPWSLLVLDAGASSLGVSLVVVQGTTVRVLASACDPKLGGRDFDARLLGHLLQVGQHPAPGRRGCVCGGHIAYVAHGKHSSVPSPPALPSALPPALHLSPWRWAQGPSYPCRLLRRSSRPGTAWMRLPAAR
jgi:hypothetical protein